MSSGARICLVLFLTVAVSISLGGEVPLCETPEPVLTGKDGKPIWLSTKDLIKMATHCAAPAMPALFRQMRFQGQVLVDILVDDKGNVTCARLVNGHPLVAGAAVDAAKDWTFQPMKQGDKSVFFYGHLSFTFQHAPCRQKKTPA